MRRRPASRKPCSSRLQMAMIRYQPWKSRQHNSDECSCRGPARQQLHNSLNHNRYVLFQNVGVFYLKFEGEVGLSLNRMFNRTGCSQRVFKNPILSAAFHPIRAERSSRCAFIQRARSPTQLRNARFARTAWRGSLHCGSTFWAAKKSQQRLCKLAKSQQGPVAIVQMATHKPTRLQECRQ